MPGSPDYAAGSEAGRKPGSAGGLSTLVLLAVPQDPAPHALAKRGGIAARHRQGCGLRPRSRTV
ncbi:hypothetical protein [Streptomyces sp. NBC_01244]|uniref:hypothetical protein n=1 Tax=Streptomyces sp. NBC_01244 TaxID=2903797 RepID=UPI002E0EBAAC|nr:hypothetical protein OG247_00030 [Streptomyces sp. NBC_01244]